MKKTINPKSLVTFLFVILLSTGILGQDRWSDAGTWPTGRVPIDGENVVIPEGRTILLDTDTQNLGSLTINGQLLFEDRDLSLTARWIMVHGLLQIGTREHPFVNEATIILTGPEEDVNTMGGRFLATMHGGSLEIHGQSANKLGWAQIDKSLGIGDTEMVLSKDPVGWNIGDRIAIAPSGYDPFEAEEVTITHIAGRTIRFTPAVQYEHFGELQEYEGKELDERAEVGLLTRNVKIQGASDSFERKFGGHIMVMFDSGPIHVEGVEFTAMGQPGLEARYNFHWHLAGDREGDYLRNSSIHHGMQRGVVVHQTNNVLVENVVAFDIKNHVFVPAEDGNEVDNTFKHNLAILVRRPDQGDFAFPREGSGGSSQGEQRVAGFWMRNPHNNLIGNHVGGSERGVGFFFDSRSRLRDFKEFDLLPREIVFDGNVAHSCSVVGPLGHEGVSNHALYSDVGHGHGFFMTKFFNGDLMWKFSNFVSYKNMMSGVWTEIASVTLDNFMIADNSIGLLSSDSYVENTIVVGKSKNTIGGENRYLRFGDRRAGYYTHAQGGRKEPKLTNVTFIDINKDIEEGRVAAAIIGHGRHKEKNFLKEIKVVGETLPVWMSEYGGRNDGENSSMLLDADGSVTGYDRPVLIAHPYSSFKKDAIEYREEWQAYIVEAEGAMQLRISEVGFDLPQEVSLIRDFDNHRIPKMQFAHTRYFNFFGQQSYTVLGQWEMKDKGSDLELRSVLEKEGEWSLFKYPMPYTDVEVIDVLENPVNQVHSLKELHGQPKTAYYFDVDRGALYLKMVTEADGSVQINVSPRGNNTGNNFGLEEGSAEQYFRDMVVHPNPLSPDSKLEYTLYQKEHIGIELYDLLGRKIKNVFFDEQNSGTHSIPLGNLVSQSGVYILSVQVENTSVPLKIIKP